MLRLRLAPKERQRIEILFERFEAASAHPKTELGYTSPFTLLVAVVLSAQATDKSVNKATEILYRTADTPEKIIALGINWYLNNAVKLQLNDLITSVDRFSGVTHDLPHRQSQDFNTIGIRMQFSN